MANGSITLSFAGFSYDSTSLFVATSEGVKVFGLKDSALLYETDKTPHASLVVQLYGGDILCVVTKSEPKKMQIMSMSENKILQTKHFLSDILDIKSNKSVLVIACRDALYFYEHSVPGFKSLYKINKEHTYFNGLFALSQATGGPNYCALSACHRNGDVDVFDVDSKKKVTTIRAHQSSLAALVFHPTEQVLATASKKGTVIRLISVPSGTNLCEFRRGLQRNATIYSLSFSSESNFLITSGSTGTVHVFKYELPGDKSEEKSWSEYLTGAVKSSANFLLGPSNDLTIDPKHKPGWTSYFGEMITSSANFIPKQMYEVYNQVRSFLKIRLSENSIKNISVITRVRGEPRVVVFTEDSFVSVYEMTEAEEEKMVSRHSPLIGHVPTIIVNDWSPRSVGEGDNDDEKVNKSD